MGITSIVSRTDRAQGATFHAVQAANHPALDNAEEVYVQLRVDNHDRNLQLPIDDLANGWGLQVGWEQ